jgi:hypothetical protein
MSLKDGAIELLNKWKSDGARMMVMFLGTDNFVTFALQGTISGADRSSVVFKTLDGEGLVTFGIASARTSSGSPKGNSNPDMALFCDRLRLKEVDVVEFFFDFGNVLLFSELDAADMPLRPM